MLRRMSEPVEEVAEVCRINIGPRERAKRMRFGVISLALGVGIAAALIVLGVPRMWRLALFAPFAIAGIGVFQAREKT